jgi:osmoprotectant transport system substrate-binding protein
MKVQYMKLFGFFITVLVALALFSGTGFSSEREPAEEGGKGPIVVASKIDTEGALLGQMILHLLEANGFDTVDKVQFGTTDVIRKAIFSGEIDMYPEYTGNGGFFYEGTDPSIWKDPKRGYEKVKQLDREAHDIVWLTPAPANNTWALAIRGEIAESEGVRTLDDFADWVNAGNTAKIAGCEEFVSRPDALPAFENAYGFEMRKDQLLIFSGCNTAQTEKAAADGTDGVNVAMAFGTDGQLAALGLWVLEDTKGVQPYYQPTPIVRGEIYNRYPEIEKILDPVFKSLDLVTLQTLNSKIAIEGQPAKDVARAYLESEGFLK